MAKLTGSAPIVLVRDVRQAAAYADKLGFTDCTFYGSPTDFCIARRDNYRRDAGADRCSAYQTQLAGRQGDVEHLLLGR